MGGRPSRKRPHTMIIQSYTPFMAHKLKMKIDSAVPIVNTDVKIEVFIDSAKHGTVKISRGSIDWLPKNASTRGFRMTWRRFSQLMMEQGRET